MARLSGLPSEHHHEGPGDAPRRKRTRKSQTPSVDLTSTGKRTASPDAETSKTKRPKRLQPNDHDQSPQGLAESTLANDTIHLVPQTSPTSHRNRRYSEPLVAAQNHTNGIDDHDNESAPPEPSSTQPIPGLTPHLDRVGASRSRISHAARRARLSMPAQLRLEPVDETDGNRQVQFAPLSAVLDSRTRRRLRRSHLSQEVNEIEEHQKEDKKLRKAFADLRRQLRERDDSIRELEYQLEARRLGNIDMTEDRAQELEQQLQQARKEIEELRASSIYTGSDQDPGTFDMDSMEGMENDDDELMLINPDELGVSQDDLHITPSLNGTFATRALELSSQVTFESLSQVSQANHDTLAESSHTPVSDKLTDQAIERYERELQHYAHLLAESQGALRIIAIELQNLHITPPGTASNEILTELRHAFDTLRQEVDRLFPNTTANLNNRELLRNIPDLLEGMLEELREKVLLVESHRKTEKMLRSQYEGVLHLLGDSEDCKEDLERKVQNLDRSNEDKQIALVELRDSLEVMTKTANEQARIIEDKDIQIQGQETEIGEKDTALLRLRESLNKYREDLDSVTTTATRLEEDHRETISRMEQEFTSTIENLQVQLGAEMEAREAAESDAQQKSKYIDELEDRINRLDTDVDSVTDELIQLRERLAKEIVGREVAESERDEQTTAVYEHANMIENLNETILDLQNQLTAFRQDMATERAQREKTEMDLEEANEKIKDLTIRVDDIGVQADELRSKLFQVQQEREEAITQLNEEADEREDALQDQLDAELQRGREAELKISNLEETILQLEQSLVVNQDSLSEARHALTELQKDREELVASLSAQLSDLKSKYAALENSTNSTITTLQANITDLHNRVRNQKAEIERITENAAEEKRTFDEETAIMAAKITDLEDDLSISRTENEHLTKENKSLAQRVEDEANELLNVMGTYTEEANTLRSLIETQDAIIKNLQNAANQRLEEHAEEIAEKQEEIEELRIIGDARAENIVALQSQIEELKERFGAQEQDTRTTMDALIESQRRLQEQNEHLAAALKKRSADALLAVQEMKVKGIEIKTKGVNLHKVANGKVSKTNEKVKVVKKGSKKKVSRRQWDSGFGIDENVEDMEDALVA